jgi:hypothetical protein
MDYLGLFCLGAFVGTISVIGVKYIENVQQWQNVIIAIIPVALSSVTIVFIDRFKYSPAIGCYPLGLVAALMLVYIDKGIEYRKVPETKKIGLFYVIASIFSTAVSIVIVSIPAYLQIIAEMTIPTSVRVTILNKERDKALINISEREVPKTTTTPATAPTMTPSP